MSALGMFLGIPQMDFTWGGLRPDRTRLPRDRADPGPHLVTCMFRNAIQMKTLTYSNHKSFVPAQAKNAVQ